MSEKPKFKYALACAAADEIFAMLKPFTMVTPSEINGAHCGWPGTNLIEIAGSLRRCKPEVGDIEILFVPAVKEVPDGLFDTKLQDFAEEEINRQVKLGVFKPRPNVNGGFTWGAKNKLAIHVASGIPVDFFSCPVENWWNSLVVRTGSKDMNLELTTSAIARARNLQAYGAGVKFQDGHVELSTSEESVFRNCGVKYREPRFR